MGRVAFFLIAAAYLILCGWLIFPDNVTFLHDNLLFHYPVFDYVLANIHQHGVFPLWLPGASLGIPSIVYSNNFYFFLPTHIPFYLIAWGWPGPLDTFLLYKCCLILSNLCFGIAGYWLLREWFSRTVSLFGFAALLFSGVTTATFFQEEIIATLFYVPLCLLCLVRLYRRKKFSYFVLTGLFFGHSLNNHYPQLILYIWGIFALSFLVCYGKIAIQLVKTERTFWLSGSLVSLVALLVTVAPLAYNTTRYLPLLVSQGRFMKSASLETSYDFIKMTKEINSLSKRHLLSFITPPLTGRAHTNPLSEPSVYVDDTVAFYISLIPLLLMAVAVAGGASRFLFFWMLSVFLAFHFAIGGHGFVYRILFALGPAFKIQRVPLHMTYFMMFCAICLGCLGLKFLLEKVNLLSRKGTIAAGVFATLFFIDIGYYFVWSTRHYFPELPPDSTFVQLSRGARIPAYTEPTPPPAQGKQLERFRSLNGLIWFRDALIYGSTRGLLDSTSRASYPNANRIMASAPLAISNLNSIGDTLRFTTSGENPAQVVWMQNFHPDWTAKIDHTPVAPQKIHAFVGLNIPAGSHQVELSYQSRTEAILIYGSILLVILTFLTATVLWQPASNNQPQPRRIALTTRAKSWIYS